MEVHQDTLDKVMQMSYLELKPREKKARQQDLNRMVVWVKRLLEVDTAGVEPLVTLSSETNRFGDDRAEGALSQEEAVYNAPDAVAPYFSVPRVKS